MHSGSALYQLMLVFVVFGGLSVMIAFVMLLPVVGAWLNVVFAVVMGDKALLARKGESVWEVEP